METKFTRGPWTSDGSLVWVGTEVGLRELLADVDGSNHEKAKSNAALIAAAPDLYAALSDLMENEKFHTMVGGNPRVVEALLERCASALKKARGE